MGTEKSTTTWTRRYQLTEFICVALHFYSWHATLMVNVCCQTKRRNSQDNAKKYIQATKKSLLHIFTAVFISAEPFLNQLGQYIAVCFSLIFLYEEFSLNFSCHQVTMLVQNIQLLHPWLAFTGPAVLCQLRAHCCLDIVLLLRHLFKRLPVCLM